MYYTRILFFILFWFSANSIYSQYREVILHDGVSLRILLKYLPEAGLSRPDWIGIQVENKTDHPLKIDGAGYHFDEAVTSTDDKECWNFGRYGSGSVFDLFPFFRQSPNPSDLLKNFFLQPKETVFLSETISDYAAAMLHNRDTATRHIRARLNFQLHNSSEKVDANYPFFFDWSPPEHADRAALKHRLETALECVDCRFSNTYLILTLLRKPDIAGLLTPEQYFMYLRQTGCGTSWPSKQVLEYLVQNLPDKKILTQYYLDRIESGESCLFDELSSCWDDMFAQPILEAWLASDSPNYSYLWLLNAHPGSWENIPGAKERLAAKVFDLFGISPQQKIPADRLGESLSQIANVLQVTRDSSAAIFLSQYLTDNTPTGREKLGLPFYSEPYLRPLRNCDKALEAIYYILGRDIRAEYYKALFPQQAPKVWIVNGAKKHYDVPEILFDKTWMTEQRDRLIKELQKEMSE